jgi:hypothetical protein
MDSLWKQKMRDVTSVSLTEAFDMYLECGLYYKDGKLYNPKNISIQRIKFLKLIYERTGSFNPYSICKFN